MTIPSANLAWRLRARARAFRIRSVTVSEATRRELLIHGEAGSATILDTRPRRTEPCHVFDVRVQLSGQFPYETTVHQHVPDSDLQWMRPGDVVCCCVDPRARARIVLYVPEMTQCGRSSVAKILADGRRAEATVLAAAPVAADYSGRDDPFLRLDLEVHAWDEPVPWRVRIVQSVPLSAIGLVDLGRRLEVAFFTVDRGETVAIDWASSRWG